MKPHTFAILLTTLGSFSAFARPPVGRASEAISKNDKPFAVEFNDDRCLMCGALTPVSGSLAQSPEFTDITLFVAKFDTAKVLQRSLGITEHRTVQEAKDGKKVVGAPVVAQYATLSELLDKVIS
jgi:hypothetical protein